MRNVYYYCIQAHKSLCLPYERKCFIQQECSDLILWKYHQYQRFHLQCQGSLLPFERRPWLLNSNHFPYWAPELEETFWGKFRQLSSWTIQRSIWPVLVRTGCHQNCIAMWFRILWCGLYDIIYPRISYLPHNFLFRYSSLLFFIFFYTWSHWSNIFLS